MVEIKNNDFLWQENARKMPPVYGGDENICSKLFLSFFRMIVQKSGNVPDFYFDFDYSVSQKNIFWAILRKILEEKSFPHKSLATTITSIK